MASDLIYKEAARMATEFIQREAALGAQNKSMNLKECRIRLERLHAADVRPVDEISDSVDEAIDYLNSVSNQMPYHVYSALFDLICGICPTCGADMRQVVEIEQIKELIQ